MWEIAYINYHDSGSIGESSRTRVRSRLQRK